MHRMPFVHISDESRAAMRAMAGELGDRYVSEILLPGIRRATGKAIATTEDARLAFADPYLCLRALYGHYAFSRRGKERLELADIALEALERTAQPNFETFVEQHSAETLWAEYLVVCEERGRKPLEQQNLGVIAGLGELAQEVYGLDGIGSIAEWVIAGVAQTKRIEPRFLRMVDVRGIGPKLASLFMRDVVFLYGLEDELDPVDRLYVQPVDKWLRQIAPLIAEEVDEEAADWILAGKLAKYTRKGGVSGIRFNMGVTYFGMKLSRDKESFAEAVMSLIQPTRSSTL
jgi:hypothetical protein